MRTKEEKWKSSQGETATCIENFESSSRMMKPTKRGKNLSPSLSIDDLVKDIVHNRKYNTIRYRYVRSSDKDIDSVISVVLVRMRTLCITSNI